jgi:4-amino-4-deoxy-L-arabinose transferase-like glycosyltransferase
MTPIPYWLEPLITLFPALCLMFLGVGVPWALAVLPRADWRRPLLVLAVAIPLGAMLTTTALFPVATFSRLTRESVLIAACAAALIGVLAILVSGIVSRNDGSTEQSDERSVAFRPTVIDILLIAVIALSVLIRFVNTAYWSYTTYDEFWVYGYNAKIFTTTGAIPATMGYYPQNVPLAYTFMQVLWGGVNDHAARTVVPVFALGSILITYAFGAKLFSPRVGLIAAAVWALYPQHAAWSQFGDLEVPVTLYFTGTAMFTVLAISDRLSTRLSDRMSGNGTSWRYAVLAGLMLGGALWTKPTAGSLIWSILLIAFVMVAANAAAWIKHKRIVWHEIRPVMLIAVILAVGAPIGGMWYIRNVLFGLDPLVLPAGYWQDEAARSGQEFGWIILILFALVVYLIINRTRIVAAVAGFALVLVGTLPSAFGGRVPTIYELGSALIGAIVPTIKPYRLTLVDYAIIAIGIGLILYAALPHLRRVRHRERWLLIGAFIAPYWITWFWSYSYHYRLSFAIVPLQILVLAVLLARIKFSVSPVFVRFAAAILIIALALPGLWAGTSSFQYIAMNNLPDEDARYAVSNPALWELVTFFRQRKAELGRELVIVAPGEQRLPFFFPEDRISTEEFPTLLDEIAHIDYYVDSSTSHRLYLYRDQFVNNQIITSRTRDTAMRRVLAVDDGNFRYFVYQPLNEQRFAEVSPNAKLNLQLGDSITLIGADLSTGETYPGGTIFLTLYWRTDAPIPQNYSVFIHLWDAENQKLIQAWGGEPISSAFSVWQNVPGEHFSQPYPTSLWQPGEIVRDEWKFYIANDAPRGRYDLRVGLFDPLNNTDSTQARLPVTENGEIIGDSVYIYHMDVR